MHHEAQLLEAELNAGYEAVMSFTEACRFATNDELKAPALQLAAQAEPLLAAASQALLAAQEVQHRPLACASGAAERPN